MKSRLFFLLAIIMIVILFFTGARRAGRWLVKEDEGVHADAMVILMGSIEDRVFQAEDIYNELRASEILMVETRQSGEEQKFQERRVQILSNTQQSRDALVLLGISPDSIIILPGGATSTQMEAMSVREYLKNKPDIDTILLISSPDHTRRASMIFKRAFASLESPPVVFCSPSKYTNFDPDKWWKSRDGIETVFMEYLKIANFLLIDRWKL